MKRRDLLKAGLIAPAAAALLSGCAKEKQSQNNSTDIIPKQTGTYLFSVPLPFDFKVIDKIVEFNERFKKSKIVMFYNSAPTPLADRYNRWFQMNRGENQNVTNYDQFFKYVRYAKERGFGFTYLMNSTKSLSEKDFLGLEKEFHWLLDRLHTEGVDNIKFSNTQVASLINEYKHDFNLSSSTAAEYHNISQYKNLVHNYPNVKLIDIAIDENQNFKFLKTMKKTFPDIKMEIMVNEPCFKGCPARISHEAEVKFKVFECNLLRKSLGSVCSFFKTSAIYPWNLEYYSAIGINNFKFMPEGNVGLRGNFVNLNLLENYLTCVDEGPEKFSAKTFFNEMFNVGMPNISDNIKLTHIIPFLPDIKHFIKHGHECATRCDVDCNYCHKCAKDLEDVLSKLNV